MPDRSSPAHDRLRSNNLTVSIQVAAERTGLNPHVIRAWERRYGAIQPARSAGRQRMYGATEITRLALLHRAVRNGHGIGKIANLSLEELRALAVEPSESLRPEPQSVDSDSSSAFRKEALVATRKFDGPALEDIFRRALVAFGNQGLLRLIISPLTRELGELWRTGELTAAHEHFFTASVKVFLGELTRQFALPLSAPRIIVSTPAGQLHELGAVMAAAIAANLGWRSIYLGPSLPAHEIAGAVLRNEAAAVALSIVYPEDDPELERELADLARLIPAGTRILTGGRAARRHLETIIRVGGLYADTIDEFGEQLDRLRHTQLPG